jgi:putative peptidoglycan lipid II flippase
MLIPAIAGLSRLLGLVREALLSKMLGLGAALDLFVIFTTVPTYALAYMMGPFGIAFYACLSGGQITALGLWRRLLPWTLGGGLFVGVLVFIAAAAYEPRVRMAEEMVAGYWPIAFGGAAIVPVVVMIGMGVCLLHAERKHGTAISLSVAQPWLFVLLLLGLDLTLLSVALWPVGLAYIGSFLLAMAIAAILLRHSLSGPPGPRRVDELAAFKGNLGLTSLETAGFFANQLLTMVFAGLTGAGGIAANGLVARILLTPLSLMLSPLSPVLQNAYRDKAPAQCRRIFLLSYAGGLSLIASLSVLIVVFGDDVVRLLLQRGAFGPEDTARVAALMLPYGVYVIFIAANQLCAVSAFSSGNGKAYTYTMLGNYLCGNLLKIPMVAHYGLAGVIWAAAATEGVAALINSRRQLAQGQKAVQP